VVRPRGSRPAAALARDEVRDVRLSERRGSTPLIRGRHAYQREADSGGRETSNDRGDPSPPQSAELNRGRGDRAVPARVAVGVVRDLPMMPPRSSVGRTNWTRRARRGRGQDHQPHLVELTWVRRPATPAPAHQTLHACRSTASFLVAPAAPASRALRSSLRCGTRVTP
jgi:hypothetical protein